MIPMSSLRVDVDAVESVVSWFQVFAWQAVCVLSVSVEPWVGCKHALQDLDFKHTHTNQFFNFAAMPPPPPPPRSLHIKECVRAS